jgi:hypothetical protein
MVRFPKKQNIDPLSPPCRKTIYQTREEAEDMIKYIKETRITRPVRTYQCPVCGFWHLTSR